MTISQNDLVNSMIEDTYQTLISKHQNHVVWTLILRATQGHNQAYINFPREDFCRGIGRPSNVLYQMLKRILNSDSRLVGVKIDVWNNAANTVHFKW